MAAEPGQRPVSIPERVWGGLERMVHQPKRNLPCVSIPERVWGGLEQDLHRAALQSTQVSIPERVWGGLEPLKPWASRVPLRGFNP